MNQIIDNSIIDAHLLFYNGFIWMYFECILNVFDKKKIKTLYTSCIIDIFQA